MSQERRTELIPEPVGHIFSPRLRVWFSAPGMGVTETAAKAHRYTESEAKKLLKKELHAASYTFVPLPGQFSRPDSSKPSAKPTPKKLYSFRGHPDVEKLLADNPTEDYLLLEINDTGKNPYWKIISRKFASERILDNKEQALKTFEMLTEPEPPKEERWVVAWDGKRSISSAVPSILATEPGDPFAVVRIRGDKAWYHFKYHFKGNAVSENSEGVGVEEAFRLVEKARLAARGPYVKVFGKKGA